jgi:probable F420-dependent oxidoreductase
MPAVARYGITVPIDRTPLAEHRPIFEELVELGYTDVWSAEASGTDAFSPLVLASAWAPSLQLGTGIVPSFTRGPATLAMSVAALAECAPGRVAVGIGSSSDVIVERWNGLRFERPYQRNHDMVRFLRAALSGERVDAEYPTFAVRGFRLERPPAVPPRLLVAALRPRMLRLAGREADGTVINWLAADDVARVVEEVGSSKDVVCRIYVCPSEDAATVRELARPVLAAYLNVGVYAAFQRWLGRGPKLEAMWEAWGRGDRRGALAAIPDDVVDELVVHGSPEECRAHIERYVAAGVTVPVLAPLPLGVEPRTAARLLAPRPAAQTPQV